jgi:hypothetical protein
MVKMIVPLKKQSKKLRQQSLRNESLREQCLDLYRHEIRIFRVVPGRKLRFPSDVLMGADQPTPSSPPGKRLDLG